MTEREISPDLADGLTLVAGSASLVGKVRTANEDSVLVSADVLVVADGMGGHLAGEVASAEAVEVLARAEGHRSLVELVSAVHLANRRISDRAAEDSALRGMGTTICVAGLVDEDGEHLAVLNVGDSRVYLLAGGELHQLTEDHSLVETLVREGRITEAEAQVHPQRNVLTRALGVEALVLVDAWLLQPCDGDRLLLCSDGLFNELSVERITEILSDQDEPAVAARRLAAEAEAAGGRDNISTVVADVAGSGRPAAPYEGRYRRIATPAVDFDDPYRDASSDTAIVPLVPIIAIPDRPDEADVGPDGPEGSDDEEDLNGEESAALPDPEQTSDLSKSNDEADDEDPRVGDNPLSSDVVTIESGSGSGRSDLNASDLNGSDLNEEASGAVEGGNWRTPVFVLAVVLVIVAALGAIAITVRSGWYVGADGNAVVIYKGPARNLPIVGDSIVERFDDIRVDTLPENRQSAIMAGKGFSSEAKARSYVANLTERPSSTTTTTTTTSTTTTTTTTTTTPTTSVAATAPGAPPGAPPAPGPTTPAPGGTGP